MFNFWKKDRKPINTIEQVVDVIPRTYSDKGVGKCKSKRNPWRAYLAFSVRDIKGNKTKTYTHHIGQYSTKEEAQKARWEFIENLK